MDSASEPSIASASWPRWAGPGSCQELPGWLPAAADLAESEGMTVIRDTPAGSTESAVRLGGPPVCRRVTR